MILPHHHQQVQSVPLTPSLPLLVSGSQWSDQFAKVELCHRPSLPGEEKQAYGILSFTVGSRTIAPH
jgi:hypothetical protein